MPVESVVVDYYEPFGTDRSAGPFCPACNTYFEVEWKPEWDEHASQLLQEHCDEMHD